MSSIRGGKRWLWWTLLILLLPAAAAAPARADAVTAVPALDLGRLTGSWFVIAQYPIKFQKRCVANDQFLYALDDKTGHYQLGVFCTLKNTSPENINFFGKRDKFDDGRLKVSSLVLFSKKYWVLALGPEYKWAVVGSPNHKALWILSRERILAPDALQQAQGVAAAKGFSTAKLVTVRQDPPGYTDVSVASAQQAAP